MLIVVRETNEAFYWVLFKGNTPNKHKGIARSGRYYNSAEFANRRAHEFKDLLKSLGVEDVKVRPCRLGLTKKSANTHKLQRKEVKQFKKETEDWRKIKCLPKKVEAIKVLSSENETVTELEVIEKPKHNTDFGFSIVDTGIREQLQKVI